MTQSNPSTDPRALLAARLAALRGTARPDLEALHVPSGHADPMDQVTAEAERALAHGRLDHAEREARALECALARLDAGEYGMCEDCDEPIAPARLRLLPEASRCVRCQAAYERNLQ